MTSSKAQTCGRLITCYYSIKEYYGINSSWNNCNQIHWNKETQRYSFETQSNKTNMVPRMLCKENGIWPHLQMGVTIMGFAEHFRQLTLRIHESSIFKVWNCYGSQICKFFDILLSLSELSIKVSICLFDWLFCITFDHTSNLEKKPTHPKQFFHIASL